jgi:Glycosyl transferase family 2
VKALVQDDKDLGRKQDLLPPFESPAGANRRAQLLSHADILDLIAEAEAEAAEDWLLWADIEAAQRFPRDMTLMARRLLHASFRGDTGLVRTLRTVLKSLPPAERRKPVILDALVRADFLLGQFEAGDAHLAELLALAPEHDVQRIVSARLRALVMAGRLSAALDLARASPRSTDPDLTLAICQTYQEAGATGELCAHVDRAGGIAALNEPATAGIYLAALEALGQLDACFAAGLQFLDRVPASASVARQLRHVAIRLDRLAEVTPALLRCAEALAGRPEALELGALVALDADDYALARAKLAEYADQTGEAACRLRLGIATTDPASPRRAVRRAYRAYRRLGVGHAGPEMQYASYLMNAARRRADLTEALAVTRVGLPHARGNPYFHRLLLSLLIACGHEDDARAHLAGLPEAVRDARLLREVDLRFRQAEGDHAGVRAAWATHARQGGYRVFSAVTEPPVPVRPGQAVAGRVVVFAVVFNGIDYIQPFLDHYRALGVESFVIVDNASTDGTREALAAASDVVLYDQPGSFRAAAHGVAWINPLLQEHSQGRWALFVDIDEHLVFPGMDLGRGLSDLLDYAEAQGAGCFPSYMLDLFASPGSAREGFAGHRYFDREYVAFPSVLPPYRMMQGGVRGRLTGRQFLITKSPLVKVDPEVIFLENNHLHTHLPPCDVTTALLHYKFVGDATARFVEAVERGEHFLGGRFYRDMLARMKGQGIRRGLWSRTYQGAAQLVRMGLMTTTPEWERWKR